MSDTFAKLFNVGGNGRQVLVFRERDDDQDLVLMHHITVLNGIRLDLKVEFHGEDQDERAERYLEDIDLGNIERMYLSFLETLEG